MAVQCVIGGDVLIKLLLREHNNAVQAIAELESRVHADRSSESAGARDLPSSTALEVTAPNATNLATAITLALDLKRVAFAHFRDDLAHKEAGEFDLGVVDPTNEASLVAWCTAYKVEHNGHLEDTDKHLIADVTNAIAASTPTDLAECITLLNEAKTDLNAHILDAPTGPQKIRDLTE